MADNYAIWSAVKENAASHGVEIQPASGLMNVGKTTKLIQGITKILQSQGEDTSDERIVDILNTSVSSLSKGWHAYDLEAQRAVERYFRSHPHTPADPSVPTGSGQGSTGGGQASGDDGDDDGEGHGGVGGGMGDDGDGDDGDPVPVPAPAPAPAPAPEPPHNPEDDPVDPNYIAPPEWSKILAILRWNKNHPGKQKNIMLVGPRGVGKTEMVIQLAKKFYQEGLFEDELPHMITSPQAKHEVCGYGDAQGRPVLTQFTEGYVKAGIVLVEEIDRSEPTPLIAANAATANKIMDTPVVGMIKQHPLCTIIATANTAGVGATEDYITANQLDASTRDRYVYIKVSFDKNIALKIARKDRALVDFIERWNTACEVCGLIQNTCSYRALTDMKDLEDMGFSVDEAMEMAILKECMPKDNLASVLDKITIKANKYYKAMAEIQERMVDVSSL